MSTEYVFVYGPPASGKTLNSQAIAEFFHCDAVVDGWSGEELPWKGLTRVLVFVLSPQDVVYGQDSWPLGRVWSIKQLKSFLGDRWIEPVRGWVEPRTKSEVTTAEDQTSQTEVFLVISVQYSWNRFENVVGVALTIDRAREIAAERHTKPDPIVESREESKRFDEDEIFHLLIEKHLAR